MKNKKDNNQDEIKDKRIDTKDASILIVEDSKTQLTHLKYILENKGYKVFTAENGLKALSVLDEKHIDIIISDIIMPEMDGYELCGKIKKDKRYRNTPIILLTALTDPSDVIKGLNVGADNFIPKPFSDEFLLSRINHLLINCRLRSTAISDIGLEIFFAGNRHLITSERMQIIDLLLSTYENAVNKNNELLEANLKLNKLKDNLEKKNSELESINEEKNQFLGIAAHDLRNPLGNILSFTEILNDELKGKLNNNQNNFLGIIKESAKSLLDLVNDLLDISKIEAGKLILKKKQIDIIEFIKKNINNSIYLAKKKNIDINLKYFDSFIDLDFDPNRIEQVLNNLLSNAIKYSHPNTVIDITIKNENNQTKVSISDQGIGIPQNEQSKLFKPFSTTSISSTAGEISTGLGLFTCKKIIDAHNGIIGLRSQTGKGSIFYFSLPNLRANTDVSIKKTSKMKLDLSKIRFLLVDDIEMNYRYFKGSLLKVNATIEWAKDAGTAIEKCKKTKFDVILMDIHMPGFNGLEATRRIRKFDKEVIIIGQTAYAMEGMDEKCILAGCNDYTGMPVRPNEIIEIIVKNLKKKKHIILN